MLEAAGELPPLKAVIGHSMGGASVLLATQLGLRSEAVMTIEDSKALTKPWVVTKRYRRQPANTWVWDYACAENNRNPISPSGRTLTIGPDGKILDKVVD